MSSPEDRLRAELARAARPASPDGVLDRVRARRGRVAIMHRVRVAALGVAVVAGTAGGTYGLARVFGTPGQQGPGTIVTPVTGPSGVMTWITESPPPTGPWGTVAPTAIPPTVWGAQTGDIRFLLEVNYQIGDTVKVRILNVGEVPYLYQEIYQACYLTYRDQNGRVFIIPPGTHCDLVVERELAPGEIAELFTWHLDECIVDNWGCAESESLRPGNYTIEGRFEPVGGGPAALATATFRIVGNG